MSDNVCKGMLNMRIRYRLEQTRLTSARRELEILETAKELVDASGPNSSKNVAQARAKQDTLDKGVAILKVSILRADQTLAVLSDFL